MVRGLFLVTALACSSMALAGNHGAKDCVMVEAGTEAKSDGRFITGKFGAWGDAVDVKSGAKAPAAGAWCAGCVEVAKDAKAPGAGSFYTGNGAMVQMVKKDDKASDKGLYCPGGNGQVPWTTTAAGGATSGAATADCTMVEKGTVAKSDGRFITGKFGAWGDAMDVKSGAAAPAAGAWCANCVEVAKDAKAPGAGSFYTGDGAKVQMVKKDDKASEKGLYCPGGSGVVPWLKAATTGAAGATTAAAGTSTVASGTNFPYSLSMLVFSALAIVMKI